MDIPPKPPITLGAGQTTDLADPVRPFSKAMAFPGDEGVLILGSGIAGLLLPAWPARGQCVVFLAALHQWDLPVGSH